MLNFPEILDITQIDFVILKCGNLLNKDYLNVILTNRNIQNISFKK